MAGGPREALDGCEIEVIGDVAGLDRLAPEWAVLHRAAASPNPFAHPAWVTAWARRAQGRHELHVVALRRDGALVAVAPFVRRRLALGAATATVLQLVGAFAEEPLTEIPEVLARPADRRWAVAAIVRALVDEGGWDWLEVALPREGWHEEGWVPSDWATRGGAVRLKGSRAFVVLPLPSAGGLLRPSLKRNMREAVRRADHRLAAQGEPLRIDFIDDPAALPAALDSLIALHRARAAEDVSPRHRDLFAGTAAEALLRDSVPGLAAAGLAACAELRLGDRLLASRLVLDAGDAVFLSCSGFDPDAWRLCAPTALMTATLERAIGRGAAVANLSHNPDQAKLRWSEHLELHHDFLVIPPGRRSRLLFALYWQHRAARFLRPG